MPQTQKNIKIWKRVIEKKRIFQKYSLYTVVFLSPPLFPADSTFIPPTPPSACEHNQIFVPLPFVDITHPHLDKDPITTQYVSLIQCQMMMVVAAPDVVVQSLSGLSTPLQDPCRHCCVGMMWHHRWPSIPSQYKFVVIASCPPPSSSSGMTTCHHWWHPHNPLPLLQRPGEQGLSWVVLLSRCIISPIDSPTFPCHTKEFGAIDLTAHHHALLMMMNHHCLVIDLSSSCHKFIVFLATNAVLAPHCIIYNCPPHRICLNHQCSQCRCDICSWQKSKFATFWPKRTYWEIKCLDFFPKNCVLAHVVSKVNIFRKNIKYLFW